MDKRLKAKHLLEEIIFNKENHEKHVNDLYLACSHLVDSRKSFETIYETIVSHLFTRISQSPPPPKRNRPFKIRILSRDDFRRKQLEEGIKRYIQDRLFDNNCRGLLLDDHANLIQVSDLAHAVCGEKAEEYRVIVDILNEMTETGLLQKVWIDRQERYSFKGVPFSKFHH